MNVLLRAAAAVLTLMSLGGAQAVPGCEVWVPPGDSTYEGTAWPGGVVYYAFDASVDAVEQLQALAAMREIEALANIDFVERSSESDYVLFADGAVNSSPVGMIGGPQVLSMSDWDNHFVICHELLHALGFWHEHQRPDRDEYVLLSAAALADTTNYGPRSGATAFGDYDYGSVMHYSQGNTMLGCSQCITVKYPFASYWQSEIGTLSRISEGDVEGLAAVYGGRPCYGKPYVGDFNGDGKGDVVVPVFRGNQADLVTMLSRGDGTFTYQKNRIAARAWTRANIERSRVLIGDVSGDGADDIVLAFYGFPNWSQTTTPQSVQVCVASDYGLNPRRWVVTSQTTGYPEGVLEGLQLADVDGDNQKDLVFAYRTGGPITAPVESRVLRRFSYIVGFVLQDTWVTPWPAVRYRGMHAGDIDADGRDELVLILEGSGGVMECAVARSFDPATGSFVPQLWPTPWSASTLQGLRVGDVDADGAADLVLGSAVGPLIPLLEVDVMRGYAPSTGAWLTNSYATGVLASSFDRARLGDADGDGKSDLLVASAGAAGTEVRVFSAFDPGTGSWSSSTQVTPLPQSAADLPAAVDVDGDGRADLVSAYGDPASVENVIVGVLRNWSGMTWSSSQTSKCVCCAEKYGLGCHGSHGVPDLRPISGPPRPGVIYSLAALNLPVMVPGLTSMGFIVTGFSEPQAPISLAPYGLPNCSAFVNVAVNEFFVGGGGRAEIRRQMPASSVFYGTRFYDQLLVLDPFISSGASVSNAVRSEVVSVN